VPGGLTFASVTTGLGFSCGVTPAGAAYCWGTNDNGQLGDGTTTDSSTPMAVSGGLAFAAVSAGDFHTCGVTTSGAAYCWGHADRGQLGAGGVISGPCPSPFPLFCSATPLPVAGELTFASVSAGRHYTCGVTTTGVGYCWGENDAGQLGNDSTTNSNVPVPISGGLAFAQVDARGSVGGPGSHTCGVTTGDAAYCWGSNSVGQLGNGTTSDSLTPVAVTGALAFASVSAGSSYTCGVTTGQGAYCWGQNDFGQFGAGQLGDGTSTNRSTPVAVSGGLAFTSVSAGDFHACGVTTGSVAYCWGGNSSGQLGDGSGASSTVPVKVAGQP
jgi:alpha-tubulin suppressor-like RCC1 family protein